MSKTYTDLVTDMQLWAQNTSAEFISQIPNCINFAELKLAREAKVLGYEKYVAFTPPMAEGVYVYAKPDRWRRTISLSIGTGDDGNTIKYLYPRDKTFLEQYWPNATLTDADQPPEYYCEFGYNNIKIAPTPPQDYPAQWGYYEIPAALSAQNQTNWNTEFIYDVLLATSLLQAQRFLKNWDMAPQWQAIYDQYVQASSVEEFNRNLDRTEGQKPKGGP